MNRNVQARSIEIKLRLSFATVEKVASLLTSFLRKVFQSASDSAESLILRGFRRFEEFDVDVLLPKLRITFWDVIALLILGIGVTSMLSLFAAPKAL